MEAKVVFTDGKEYVVKPLSQNELAQKIAQKDYEGNIYKNVFELINKNKEEIARAKPKVHKNSAGYYLWNVARPELAEGRCLVDYVGTFYQQITLVIH